MTEANKANESTESAESAESTVKAYSEAFFAGLRKGDTFTLGFSRIDDEDGLYEKYRVFREPAEAPHHPIGMTAYYRQKLENINEDVVRYAEEVTDFVFVLKPDSDPHARVALAAYAESVQNYKPQLAEDLRMIVGEFRG